MPAFAVTTSEISPLRSVRRPDHRVHIKLGPDQQAMLPTISVLDTGAGEKLIRYEAIPTLWNAFIADQLDPGLCGANGSKMRWSGELALRTQLGDFWRLYWRRFTPVRKEPSQ